MHFPLISHWLRRRVIRTVRRFELRLERFKLVDRRIIREHLLADPVVLAAIDRHAVDHRVPISTVKAQVEGYIDEIVPFFNVLSYYRGGYNVARIVLRSLYHVTSEYQDRAALDAIPRKDVVVYLMNHRSNADYVVVAYVLARGVNISYAVGEWARTWPLEYVFKSFGAYFVRRKFREPLYHAVLERYVQLITRNGVTQGIFLEGRLSRSGALGHAKLGLLGYLLRTLGEKEFHDRDIWLVPVAINYDRVLEDRVLTRELLDPGARRPGRLRQLSSVAQYIGYNGARWLTGALRRYGRVAVNFGTPVSARRWLADQPGLLDLPWQERELRLQGIAEEVLKRVAAVMPVTPVPLTAAALLSFDKPLVRLSDLRLRVDEFCKHLKQLDAKLVHADTGADTIIDRAERMFRLRRLVHYQGDAMVILPSQRPLLEYYANSVRHLLPPAVQLPEGTLLRLSALDV